jgi:hypothetical protein
MSKKNDYFSLLLPRSDFMNLITKFIAVAIATVLAELAVAATPPDFSPLRDRQRIHSTHGISILPPQGSDWLEQFGENQISYLKQTDTKTVSFFAGALEGTLQSKLLTKEALLAFVRSKKDKWGNDGRYSDTSSSFQVESENESCVRYQLSAHDRGAINKADHNFLVMETFGRFCVHPQDRTVAVDIYYSVRHVPQFAPKDFIIEGEDFLQGLQFAISP